MPVFTYSLIELAANFSPAPVSPGTSFSKWVVGRHRTNERMKFTDYYSGQSCMAGRAAFITGQRV
jgi:hypothetical protein